jgi:outer membrane protein assembly factor BamB
MIAYGQVESAWPVIGGVLVMDDTAFVLAGRTTEVDGGMYIHALEARTGRLLWTSRRKKLDDGPVGGHNPAVKTNYLGAADVLLCDGKTLYLKGAANGRIDPKTGKDITQPIKEGLSFGWLQSRFNADRYGMVTVPVARVGKNVVRINCQTRAISLSGAGGWKAEVRAPSTVESLATAGETVVVAIASNNPQQLGGQLWLLSATDGVRQATLLLPSDPVYDGTAVAHHRVFAALQDGTIVCCDGSALLGSQQQ